MSEIGTRTIRVKLDTSVALPSNLDIASWRGNALDLKVGIYDADGVASITNVSSINVKVQSSQLTNTTLMDSTVAAGAMDATLDSTSWDDGTKQHATFSFTDAQANLTLNKVEQKFWIVFSAILVNGSTVTLSAGWLTMHEDNDTSAGSPDTNAGTAITLEQADARYAALGAGGGGSGDMVAANNLSDLDDAATARANLGVDVAGTDNSDKAAIAANTAKATDVNHVELLLPNVDNTSDANKPVSTAQQTALDGKAASSHTTNTLNPHSVTKAQVGLGNVDNTSDADKPVSTAQQTALDSKSASSHAHTSAEIIDATPLATGDTIVKRSSTGISGFNTIVLYGGGFAQEIASPTLDDDSEITLPNVEEGTLAVVLDPTGQIKDTDILPVVQTLTDGSTITLNTFFGNSGVVTSTQNATLAAIVGAVPNDSGMITHIQDGTGGRSLTLSANQVDMNGTLADIAGLGPNKVTKIGWETHDAVTTYLYIVTEP